MKVPVAGTVLMAMALITTGSSRAADPGKAVLKPFNVTMRVFDPTKGMEGGRDYVLPVDSPDEKHAIASTTANAASFTRKFEDGRPLPVAFTCIRVEPRR